MLTLRDHLTRDYHERCRRHTRWLESSARLVGAAQEPEETACSNARLWRFYQSWTLLQRQWETLDLPMPDTGPLLGELLMRLAWYGRLLDLGDDSDIGCWERWQAWCAVEKCCREFGTVTTERF